MVKSLQSVEFKIVALTYSYKIKIGNIHFQENPVGTNISDLFVLSENFTSRNDRHVSQAAIFMSQVLPNSPAIEQSVPTHLVFYYTSLVRVFKTKFTYIHNSHLATVRMENFIWDCQIRYLRRVVGWHHFFQRIPVGKLSFSDDLTMVRFRPGYMS